MEKLYGNEHDIAELTGLAVSTLRSWRTRGGGPPFSKAGGRIIYRLEGVLDWLRQRERSSTSEQIQTVGK